MKVFCLNKVLSGMTSAVLTAALTVPSVMTVNAQNFLFITEIRLETGENAYDNLDADGFHVMSMGLNTGVDEEEQIYLGYRYNTGEPITDIRIAAGTGDSFVTADGIRYDCVGHMDADEGCGGGAGYVYVTRDERAGAPLVGLDLLRADAEAGEELFAIPNDGAEIVRKPDNTPAYLEAHSETITMYLAQIRDGLAAPYISELAPVTDSDLWNAVYTAAERGYHYYITGDMDGSPDTYTLIAYNRTADPEQALTGITAVSSELIAQYEMQQKYDRPTVTEPVTAEPESLEAQTETLPETLSDLPETGAESEVLTEVFTEPFTALSGDAIGISGAEYIRTSRQAVAEEIPYYIYTSRDKAAGNPIMMLYAGKCDESMDTLFGMWAYSYFTTKGASNAYSYILNEDAVSQFQTDMTVCTQRP